MTTIRQVPFPFQLQDIRKGLGTPTKGILNASICGSGKTLTAVEILAGADPQNAMIKLIIAPVNTEDTWRRTILDQTDQTLNRVSGVAGSNEAWANLPRLAKGEPGWYFAGWEMSLQFPESIWRKVDHVIFDEIHRLANRNSKSARLGHLIGRIVATRGGYRLGLSGTPFGNSLAGAWAIERALWPLQAERSFWRWANHHLKVTEDEYQINGRTVKVKRLGKEIDPGSVVREIKALGPGTYRRHLERERCCKFHPKGIQADLPPRVVHQVTVPLAPAQRAIYDQLHEDMMAWIEEHEWPITTDGWPLVQSVRMHQVCLAVPSTELAERLTKDRTGTEEYVAVKYPLTAKSSKIDALIDIISDIPPDESVLVFTHSAGIIPVIVSRLQRSPRKWQAKSQKDWVRGWHGGTPQSERIEIKNKFLTHEVRVIVAQIAAIGEGTDGLQMACHNEIWFSQSSNGMINTQCLGRLNRRGQTHTIQSWTLAAEQTVEVLQFQKLTESNRIMQTALKAKATKEKP